MAVETVGKYEIRGRLGAGAMGTVLDAWDTVIERRAALKIVKKPPAGDIEGAEALARFKREAQAAGRLTHPNIVAVYDYGEDDENAWIAMELVEGGSLKDIIDRGERFALPEVGRVMEQTLAGLDYSHKRGVVHRDIKPANIMLAADRTIKIADFGIARLENSSMTQVGTVMGTPSYMAPEQLRGETVDARADIWAAGVMLYQLLTGEKPFEGGFSSVMHKAIHTDPTPPSSLAVTAPRAFDAVISKALAKRPEDRWASAAVFADAIRAAITAPAQAVPLPMADSDATIVAAGPRPVIAPKTPAAATQASPVAKKGAPVLLIGGGIAALGAAAAAAFLLMGAPSTPTPPPPTPQIALQQPPPPAAPPAVTIQPAAPAAPLLTPTAPPLLQTAPQATAQVSPPLQAPVIAPPPTPSTSVPAQTTLLAPAPPVSPPVAQAPVQQAPIQQTPIQQTPAQLAPAPQPPPPIVAMPVRPPAPQLLPAPPPPLLQPAAPQPQIALLQPPKLDFAAAAAAAANAAPCTLISGAATENSLTLSGVARRGEETAIWRMLAARGIPLSAATLGVQPFDGPYCPALAVLRPVIAAPDAAPRVSVIGNMPLLKGQFLRFDVTLPSWPSHLYVAYFMASGEVAHLVPSATHPADAIVRLGEPRAGFPGWEVDEPFGTDLLVAVASERPLFGANRPLVEPQADYIAALSTALAAARQAGQRVAIRPLVIETAAR